MAHGWRLPPWARRCLGWVVVVGSVLGAAAYASDGHSADLWLYRLYALDAWAGIVAGWHAAAAYPAGSVLVTLPMRWSDPENLGSTWVYAIVVPITLAMLLVLGLAGRHRRPGGVDEPGWRGTLADRGLHAGVLVAAATVALYDWWLRYEPAVCLAALLGLLAARTGLPLQAGGWLAAGFWLKGWPLLLALPAARAAGARVVVALVAGVAGVWAVAAATGGDQLWSFLTFNVDRPPQPESLAVLPALLLRANGADGWTVGFERSLWAYVVTGPGVDPAATVVTVVGLLLMVAVGVAYLRATRHRVGGWGEPEARVATALTGLVVLSSPVFSPQYLAWLVPPVAVALLDGWQRPEAVALVVACALTSYVHPTHYDELVAGDLAPLLALLARDLLLLGVVVGTGWPRRTGTSARPQPAAAGQR